jgi:hypothetical protein
MPKQHIQAIIFALLAMFAAGGDPSAAAAPDTGDLARLHDQLVASDADKNGSITRTEFAHYAMSQWARMDRDKDGYFTRADLPAYARSRWDTKPIAPLRQRADTDRDGRLSRAEFRARQSRSFNLADLDRNGTVNKREMQALARRRTPPG